MPMWWDPNPLKKNVVRGVLGSILALLTTSIAPTGIKTDAAQASPLAPIAIAPFSKATINNSDKLVQIDTSITYQTFQGVGAAITGSAAYCLKTYCTTTSAAAILQEAFGTNGLGTTRISAGDCDYNPDDANGANDGTAPFVTLDDTDAATATTLTGFALRSIDTSSVIPVLQQIKGINPNLKIICAPWSPPVALKGISSGTVTLSTGYFVNNTNTLNFLANYFVDLCSALNGYGVEPTFVTINNEPDIEGAGYPSCGYAPTDISAAIKAVGPALASAGLSTSILAGDTTSWSSGNRVITTFNDSTATKYAVGGCWHAYSGSPAAAASEVSGITGKSYHMTEFCGHASTEWATMAGMVFGALNVANCSTITWWNFMLGPSGDPGPADNLKPLITVSEDGNSTFTRNPAYYVACHLGQVPLTAKRCSSTTYSYGQGSAGNASDLCTSSFLNPDLSISLVMYNANANALTVQVEDVQGGGVSTTVAMASGDMITMRFKNPIMTAVPDPAVIETTSVGNATYTIALTGAPPSYNGSAITGYDVYEGAGVGAETLVASNVALPYTGSAPNGAPAYVYVRARNAQGAGSPSNEVTFTPAASVTPTPTTSLVFPDGYLYYSQFQTATTTSGTYDVPNSYLDVQFRGNLIRYTNTLSGTSALVSNYYDPSSSSSNSPWLFGITSAGKLTFYGYDASGNFKSGTSSAALPTMTTSNAIRLRCVANCNTSAFNGYGAGTLTFLVSQDDGNSWTQLGTTVTGWTTGIKKAGTSGIVRVGTAATASGSNCAIAGRVYGVTAVSETGAVLFNPDFTAQNDNAKSFTDGAGNVWSARGCCSIVNSTSIVPQTSPGLLISQDVGAAASAATAGWSLTDLYTAANGPATVSAHDTVTDPAGGTTGSTLVFPAIGTSAKAFAACDTTAVIGDTGVHTYEIWLEGHAGGELITINVADAPYSVLGTSCQIKLTTAWQRFRFNQALSSGATKQGKLVFGLVSSQASVTIDAALPYAA